MSAAARRPVAAARTVMAPPATRRTLAVVLFALAYGMVLLAALAPQQTSLAFAAAPEVHRAP